MLPLNLSGGGRDRGMRMVTAVKAVTEIPWAVPSGGRITPPGKKQGGDATPGLWHHEFVKIVVGRDGGFIGVSLMAQSAKVMLLRLGG